MKKVLFATTALVATAGVASADVALSGLAEMGVVGGDDQETRFFQDIDVTFTLSGETDNGILFGAAIDIDEVSVDAITDSDPMANATDLSGELGVVEQATGDTDDDGGVAIFISGDFGTLTMGDTDGAFDFALQEVNLGSPGSINDDETSHGGYNGNAGLDGTFDGQVLRYDYSIAGFDLALSVELDDDTFGDPGDEITADPVYGIGARYSGDFAGGSYGVGIGYQMTDDSDTDPLVDVEESVIGVSAHVALDNGLSAAVNYSETDSDGPELDSSHFGIGASYTFDAISVHANYGMFDFDLGSTSSDAEGFGFAAGYDLGGGLNALFGYGYTETTTLGGAGVESDDNTFSLGLSMSF